MRANLSGADLSGADLSGVSLKSLRRATLKEANLTNAEVTKEQLEACRHLEGATMPDGQTLKSVDNPDRPTFEEWLKKWLKSIEEREDGENSDPS